MVKTLCNLPIDTKYSAHSRRVGECSNFYNVYSNIYNLMCDII
nr:MAG TPA: hypothetical protein [Bacteriophage sp.]